MYCLMSPQGGDYQSESDLRGLFGSVFALRKQCIHTRSLETYDLETTGLGSNIPIINTHDQ